MSSVKCRNITKIFNFLYIKLIEKKNIRNQKAHKKCKAKKVIYKTSK